MITLLLISTGLVIFCVAFHGASLQYAATKMFYQKAFSFKRISFFICVVVIAHLFEILAFTVAYVLLCPHPDFGSIAGVADPTWQDHYYFSAVTYTTTGYGDLTPTGNLRLLATVEALTGMIMIAWTASLAFLVMHRYWANTEESNTEEATHEDHPLETLDRPTENRGR